MHMFHGPEHENNIDYTNQLNIIGLHTNKTY